MPHLAHVPAWGRYAMTSGASSYFTQRPSLAESGGRITKGAHDALEVSTILLFRVGWDLSVGMLAAYVLLAVVLVFVGRIVYKQTLTPKRLIGIALSLAGVVMIGIVA